MDQRYVSSTAPEEVVTDQVIERMRRVDSIVREWVDPSFRSRINPDVPEVIGPPSRTSNRRIRNRV